MARKIDKRDLGPRPKLEWVPLDQIVIDNNFQRELDEKHANRIAAEFDWRLFSPPTLAALGNKEYSALDGQHRIEGARRTGLIEDIPSYITEITDRKAQARIFVESNLRVKKITPVDIYWASVAAGDPDYLQLEAVLRRAEVDIVPYIGYKGYNLTSSVRALQRALRRDGEEPLCVGLKVLKDAHPESKEAFPGNLVNAVSRLCSENAEVVDTTLLRRILGATDYRTLGMEAYRKQELTGGSTPIALGQAIVERYNSNRERVHKELKAPL